MSRNSLGKKNYDIVCNSHVYQWFPNRGPRAKSGPPILWMWPATVTHKFLKKLKLPCFLDFRFKLSSFFLLFCFNLSSLFVKLYAYGIESMHLIILPLKNVWILSCIVVNWHWQYAKNMFHSMSDVTKCCAWGNLRRFPRDHYLLALQRTHSSTMKATEDGSSDLCGPPWYFKSKTLPSIKRAWEPLTYTLSRTSTHMILLHTF